MLDFEFIIESFKIVKAEIPGIFYIFYIPFAASIGSFLGCYFYRTTHNMPLLSPKTSFCPNCKAKLIFWDLIPILSYIFLKAKCRHCSTTIAPTYFIIESLTVAVLVLLIL
ncbi:MAG: prepilin peptidase [Proteobacteria bacterium]|nr:prepilin peptidase [Pseudomonadota bacterium]